MKIKDGFLLKEVAGNNIIVPIGDNLVDFSAMITINETGVLLWKHLQNGAELDELVTAMTSEFDVSAEDAKSDIIDFINILKDKGILE